MRLLICAACICCAIEISAQDDTRCLWSISGIVLDEHDAASLGYATIYVKELERGVVSDSTGRFLITKICTGTYTLQFSHIGCETREQSVRVRGHVNLTLHLEHHAELLEEIQLTARRVREAGSAARAEVTPRALSRSGGRTLGEILQQLPGVTTLQTGPSVFKPVIHGLHSNRLLIVRDGLRLESQQWGLDHAPEIDPNAATRISAVKGAAAVQYGADAVAGVILVESDPPPGWKSRAGEIRLTGIDNGRQMALSAGITHGLGRGYGMRVQGTLRRAGDARAADYLLTNTGLVETGLSFDGGYQKGLNNLRIAYQLFRSELGILRSAHIGNLTDLQAALMRDRPLIVEDFSYRIGNPRQEVVHHTLRIAGQTHVETLGVLIGQYAMQWNARQEYDIRRSGRSDIPAIDLQLQTHTALISLAHRDMGDFRGKVSLHWTYQQNANMPGTGVRPLIPDFTRYVPAISWVEKWSRSNVELEAGVRYEFLRLHVRRFDLQNQLQRPRLTFHNLSATAGVRYHFHEDVTIYSHLGSTRRAPHVHELFSEGLHHGAAAIEVGDPELTPEHAVKWVTGLEVRRQKWQLDASVFFQHISDFIYLRPAGEPQLTIRGAFPVFEYVQQDARLLGAEGAVQFAISKDLQWRSEFAMVRARNLSLEEDLIWMPSDRMRHAVLFNNKKRTIDADISAEYVWRQSRVPEGIDYAPPPDGYLLFHAGVGMEVIGETLYAHVTIRNVFNTSYREYLNRLRYYADDTGRSIALRLRFVF
jgi:iron complex outermembrane recepter protein